MKVENVFLRVVVPNKLLKKNIINKEIFAEASSKKKSMFLPKFQMAYAVHLPFNEFMSDLVDGKNKKKKQ